MPKRDHNRPVHTAAQAYRARAIQKYGGVVAYYREYLRRWHSGRTCIYCHSSRPSVSRDQVVPELLGAFENSWTLDSVCDRCNHYLSRLELPLGRDSVEAVGRISHGVKPASSADKFLYKRMKTSLASGSEHHGMRARLVPCEGDVTPTPEAQVGFRLDGEEQFNYLTERELTPERVAPYSDPMRPLEIKLINARGAGFIELLNRLSSLGITFEERYRAFDQGMEPGETITIQYDFDIDNDLLRAVSKIGFNYAAFVLGADVLRRKLNGRVMAAPSSRH